MSAIDLVHENDQWMIRDKDLDFMIKLGTEGITKLSSQDDTARMAMFLSFRRQGMGATEAGVEVRKAFPIFYMVPADRNIEGVEGQDDFKIPFAVKNRLGVITLVKVKRKAVQYSSFNACVRHLIAKGEI